MKTPKKPDAAKAKKLVKHLFAEVLQTERSARSHPAKEGKRLGACPPAVAFHAISAHAKDAEKDLRRLAKERGCAPSRLGLMVGSLFSISRNRIADGLLTAERSYRATLLGVHHGVDLFALFARAARDADDVKLADWCDAWLAKRRPLVEAAVDEVGWFAVHADVALSNGKSPKKSKG